MKSTKQPAELIAQTLTRIVEAVEDVTDEEVDYPDERSLWPVDGAG
jgi:hypothetical protein